MNPSDLINIVTWLGGAFFTACITLVGITVWINKALSSMKDAFLEKVTQLEHNIITKLEYHERHDDERFQEIQRDIWDIRLRNAAKDNIYLPKNDVKRHGRNKLDINP